MATPFKFTLRQERVKDGDQYGLRLLLEAQQPGDVIDGRGVFVFERHDGTYAEGYVGVATLNFVAGPAALPLNPCDTVVFPAAHGLIAGDTLTFSLLPAGWVELADLQAGVESPQLVRTVSEVVDGTTVRVSEPFWHPQAEVHVATTDGTEYLVSVRRRYLSLATGYRDDRYYFRFDNITQAVTAAQDVEGALNILLRAAVQDGNAYVLRTNPQVTYIGLTGGPVIRTAGTWDSNITVVGGEMSSGGSGTVTSVTGGIGLGGGTITTSGTLYVRYGASSGTACEGNDIRLSDARTPVSHKVSHSAGGADALLPEDIGAMASVAPGAVGNVLTSDGAAWVSLPASGGGASAITDADVAVGAGISRSKLASGTPGSVLVNDSVGAMAGVNPGLAGNVLTSNGSSWVSTAPSGVGIIYFNESIDDTDAVLLLSGTGSAGSTTINNTGWANSSITAQGSTEIVSSPSKWGSGSIHFDGTVGTRAVATASSVRAVGYNDFTYEAWVYLTSYGNDPYNVMNGTIFDCRDVNGGYGFLFTVSTTGGLVAWTSTPVLISSVTIPLATWTHVALVRSALTLHIYQNGVLTAYVGDSTPVNSQSLALGMQSNAYSNLRFNGYMNDFRFSNTARYLANFATPAAAFTPSFNQAALPAAPVAGQLALSLNNMYTCVNTVGPVWKRTPLSSI